MPAVEGGQEGGRLTLPLQSFSDGKVLWGLEKSGSASALCKVQPGQGDRLDAAFAVCALSQDARVCTRGVACEKDRLGWLTR